ncbi:MAG: TPM domain-containing protein [Proteobacteria bacterium]|nr:TPM domain-containing protein [Pseudomonadota bacterium]
MRWLLALLLALALPWAGAQDLRAVPELSARVTDEAALLTADERAALEAKLAAFETEAGPQIAVLTVPNTAPEDIAAFAYRVASTWKIGRRDVGDGVLIIVSKDDRRVRIEVAKALEGAIPDLAARQIIDRAVRPAFREGKFAEGLSAAADQVMARIRGEHLPLPEPRGGSSQRASDGLNFSPLVFFFIGVPIIGSVLSGILGRKLGTVASAGATGGLAWLLTHSVAIALGAGVVALILVAVMGVGSMLGAPGGRRGRGGGGVPPIIWGGGGGGWGGGGGGGGWSSGGGGDFGGGGASGDW